MKNNAKRDYEHYKAKYNNTVPIRGRANERPIGERRRSHEQITAKTLLSGEVSYCAKLHNTEVVEYHANGWITLRPDGWQTPATADFMHIHSPFGVYKICNKLWVYLPTSEGRKAYPVGNELTVHQLSPHVYEPINKVLIKKKVVDRDKAKAAREPMKPFLKFCKTFLAMSDGWVASETFAAMQDTPREMHYEHLLYKYLCSGDSELHLGLMCRILRRTRWCSAKLGAAQYSYDQVKDAAYKLAEQHGDIYKVIEVEPTDKAMAGVV